MRLGGWIRLWIVLSSLYLVAVGVVTWFSLPRPEAIPHIEEFYERLTPELRNKLLVTSGDRRDRTALLDEARRRGLIEEVEMPNQHVLTFSKDVPDRDKQIAAKAYWAIVEQAAAKRRVGHVSLALLWWFVPVIGLFVLGWAMGWVYRGFKRS